jgi:NAD(P)-dependent dehydrogenase (short-subunit alcohol dehydrogenase family)
MDVPGVALITGAGSGIGRACAEVFARDGCSGLALIDINEDTLKSLKAEIDEKTYLPAGQPLRVQIYICDVINEEQVSQVFMEVAETFTRIDYVASAAGIALQHKGRIADAESKDWKRLLNVNLDGTFHVLRAAVKIMLKQEPILSSIDGRPLQRGSIVNFSSIKGVIATPMSAAYNTSKHAIIGLTKSASEDYTKDGLRINAICPGYTATPLVMDDPSIRESVEKIVAANVPMGRMALVHEVADGVVYLSGGRSSFVTGASLFVDGGYTQR